MTVLTAQNVSFQYPHQVRAAPPISLTVQKGDFLLITGASGSGKSTLMRCLVGLIPHLYHGEMTGEVWVDGLNSAETPLWQLAERAGLVFQNPTAQMLTFSVEDEIIFGLENLGLAADEIETRLEAVLAQFSLTPMRHRNPQSLSGGEQQRLALAAILARRPRVLLLDEPLSMLDTTAAQQLVEHLAAISAEGVTIVISEHRTTALNQLPQLKRLHLDGHVPTEIPLSAAHNVAPAPAPLRLDKLCVQRGKRRVIDDLSLQIEPGELVAIIGRNGVGKTTLLRAIANLQPHEGQITVGGQAPSFGLVFQNADMQLFNPTVRDEILYGLTDPDLDQYDWLLQLFNLQQYDQTPPLLLSEGEKKRVALASIVMQAPRDGLLLDEPSLGQDGDHKQRLIALMRALADAGKMILFTTHDLALAAQADRLILLGADGIVADGPPAHIFRDKDAWDTIGLIIPSWIDYDAMVPA